MISSVHWVPVDKGFKVKQFCFLILAVILTLLLPAANAAAGENTSLVYSHFANAGPLNPHLYTPNQMYAQEMIYEPLVASDENHAIIPCLAKAWDISEDGTVYTFYLRDDVTFSNGIRFNASAVEKNFTAIMANKARHAWLDLTNKILGFKAVDDFTFELTLTEPYYPALADLSLPRPFRFISPSEIPESGNTALGIRSPVGTGPWIRTESVLGVHDVFERNQTYWGKQPLLDTITIKVIPDPLSRAMALRTGEVEFVYGQGQIPFDVFASLRNDPDYATFVSRPMGTVAAAINTARFPTNELSVRLALQYLVDKDALVKGVFLDTQEAADFLFSPDVPFCDAGLKPYPFDPQLAKHVLEEAGWELSKGSKFLNRKGQTLSIEFCYIGNDAAHKAMAEVLQGQAAKVGIQLVLLGEEEDSFLQRQRDGEFGMILNPTWGPPFEPHAMLGSMRIPSHADYQAQQGLSMKQELDASITAVLQTIDEDKRADLYKHILETLHEQAVYLPLHYSSLLAAYRKGNIEHFTFGPGKTKYPFEQIQKRE